ISPSSQVCFGEKFNAPPLIPRSPRSPLAQRHGPGLADVFQYDQWLAVRHEATLVPMQEDLAIWLSGMLGEEVRAEFFMEELDNGVKLCKLIGALQTRVAQSCPSALCQLFPVRKVACKRDASPGSFFARDNTANFLAWCRHIGVEETYLFESEGLVLHKEPRQVCLCLLEVGRIVSKYVPAAPQLHPPPSRAHLLPLNCSRVAFRYGVEPPVLVKLEKEIELEESLMLTEEPPPAVKDLQRVLPARRPLPGGGAGHGRAALQLLQQALHRVPLRGTLQAGGQDPLYPDAAREARDGARGRRLGHAAGLPAQVRPAAPAALERCSPRRPNPR
ncbi:unnamed protein product, partial [Tetraodon nigroviridis]